MKLMQSFPASPRCRGFGNMRSCLWQRRFRKLPGSQPCAMPPFPVNLAALVAAEAALNDRLTMQRYVNGVKRLRAWFAAELERFDVKSYPSAGNFLLANFGPT